MTNPEMEEKLREAACFGDIEGVKELIARSAPPSPRSPEPPLDNYLHLRSCTFTCTSNSTFASTCTCTCLPRGVNTNSQHDINGWTALHWAAKRNHLNIVNLLCNHG